MKKLIYSLFVLTALSACDFLEQTPYSNVTPENFYSTEEQMRMALVSCYETINTHKIPGLTYCQYGSYGQGLLYLMNAPSDDVCASNGTQNEGLEMEWANFNEASRVVRYFWKVFYAGINRCNTIIAYVPSIPMSDAAKVQYEAEARFMRAFFYYHLAWNFGGVPIVTNFASSGEEPRSPLKDVYKLIIDDLDYACSHLNATGIIPDVSANKYTANAYMGRICNYLAACKRSGIGADLVAEQPLNDFAWVDADAMSHKACAALDTVVMKSPYVLIEDYTRLFRETTKTDQHKECLFLAELAESGSEGYWPNSFYIHTPASGGALVPTAYGGRHIPTPRGFYMYSPKDRRRDHNYTSRYDAAAEVEKIDGVKYCIPGSGQTRISYTVVDTLTGVETRYEDVPHPIYDSDTQTYNPVSGIGTCPGKIRLAMNGELQHTKSQHAFSYPLMRLADVYLMYAEALYYCGDEPEARVWMNKVLRRAATDDANYDELLAAYHRNDFIEELLESRERELVFEFSRKWDLIRFNLIDQAIESLSETMVVEKQGVLENRFLKFQTDGYLAIGIPSLKSNWFHHKIWLPISEEQMAVNKNLTQNAKW